MSVQSDFSPITTTICLWCNKKDLTHPRGSPSIALGHQLYEEIAMRYLVECLYEVEIHDIDGDPRISFCLLRNLLFKQFLGFSGYGFHFISCFGVLKVYLMFYNTSQGSTLIFSVGCPVGQLDGINYLSGIGVTPCPKLSLVFHIYNIKRRCVIYQYGGFDAWS